MRYKRSKTGIIYALVILALSLYAIVNTVSTGRQIVETAARRAALTAALASAETENARLKYELYDGTEQEKLERQARQRLGLVYPGEIIFVEPGEE